MTGIRLYNTRTRTKEPFAPIDPKNVRMYVCGPTVYDRAHLGNARPVVVFDTLFRLLRHVYGADHVTYVRNFTDVDDKINDAALARKQAGDPRSLEALIRERTDETIRWYHQDMDALGALRPTIEPRATEFIGQMIAMIAGLITSRHAYEKDGHVLFRVRSYTEYGRLSGRSVDDMIAGARVEVAPFKEDPMDFVLWKPSTDDLPGWDSPWGRGRPGWHIECSAMSHELLGESFDIHGGGIDLQFPHHENEIAQSMCAHPHGDFAKVWLHNEMLQVEGKKMSKSLGNFFTVRDLLDQGVPGEVIRFVMLSTHYSKPMDWTAEKEKQAKQTLTEWRKLAEFAEPGPPSKKVLAALTNDLNTPLVISELDAIFRQRDARTLKGTAQLIGLLFDDMGQWTWEGRTVGDLIEAPDWHPAKAWMNAQTDKLIAPYHRQIETFHSLVKPLVEAAGAFSNRWPQIVTGLESLSTRLQLLREEYPIEYAAMSEDTGVSLVTKHAFQIARGCRVVERIEERNVFKRERKFDLADAIRMNLLERGIKLVDTPDGTKWMPTRDMPASSQGGDN